MPRVRVAVSVAALVVSSAVAAAAHAGPPVPNRSTFGAQPGGFAAYHGTLETRTPAKPVQNRPLRWRGRPLVLAQSYVGRKGAEPTVGIDANGTVFTVASTFDALPGYSPFPKTIVERSTDGGRSWQERQPEIGGQNAMPISTDPYIYVDPRPTKGSGRVFDIDLQGLNGAHLAFSDDAGQTWTHSVISDAGVNDHQTLVAGPEPEGLGIPLTDPAYQKVLYYCVNGVVYGACQRSFDGGRTFTQANQTGYQFVDPVGLVTMDDSHNDGICGSLHGHAVTDNDGRLFIPRGYCNTPEIAISNDAATSFHDVVVSSGVSIDGIQSSVAADRRGNLYYVWQDKHNDQPYLSISGDHGEHWSTPRMVAPPGVQHVNFPSVTVGDPGKIAISFPGTVVADTKDKTRPWNSYVVVSTDALSANPTFLSNIANPPYDPVHRGDCTGRCAGMYDFLDVQSAVADQGRVFAAVVDTCTAVSSCSTTRTPGRDNDAGKNNAAADMQVAVVREVSGPALSGPRPWITRDTRR